MTDVKDTRATTLPGGAGAARGALLSLALGVSATLLVVACAEDIGPKLGEPPVLTTPCHQAACDPVTARCAEVPVADGASCDDHDACTENDHCVAGTCIATQTSCDDGNLCTDDRCDAALGCVTTPNTAPCDDGDHCTTGDVCAAGACTGPGVLACADTDTCTDDRCDPAVGCVNAPKAGLQAMCGALGVQCPAGFVCKDDATCASCDGSELYVPQGRFWMGCNASVDGACAVDETPQHRVVVPAFAIQRTEVTASAYRLCVEAGACERPSEAAGGYGTYDPPERAEHPVTPVNWYQAGDYCAWLDHDGADPWRLCTEAEWEKAARGSCAQHCDRADDDSCCQAAMPTYPWGDDAASCEWAIMDDGGNGCGTGITWPVASRPGAASAYGVLDLAGNVWEWVQDCWHASYKDAPADGSAWNEAACLGDSRVIRGGSFGLGAGDQRASERTYFSGDEAYDYFGFRCCRTLR